MRARCSSRTLSALATAVSLFWSCSSIPSHESDRLPASSIDGGFAAANAALPGTANPAKVQCPAHSDWNQKLLIHHIYVVTVGKEVILTEDKENF